ncbi:carbohydrate ABC transporter permease [Pseudonocardia nigra]|uniref:carbohydrate ABC transporter permease n=1 Tax=Pseudonocardia nigra TaxID=1921578 RepID=UPI001C5D2E80|nr:sugar ABC transporter permease [Pseudonocardia nigra]
MTTGTTRAERPAAAPAVAPPAGTGRRGRGRRSDTTAGYLFLSPWLVGVMLLTAGPMVASLYLSFTDYNLFQAPEWVGLDNYVAMFSDERYLQSVGVTLVYVLLSTPLKLAAALGVALLLNSTRRGQSLYRAAFYAPSLIGASVSIAIVWRAMFSEDAVVDRVLSAVGIETGGWIANPDFATLVLVSLAVWQFGAPMVIFLAGLKQIPKELTEAAVMDGAGVWRRFRSITLPMLSPVIFFNLILEMIAAFQVFTSAYVVSSGSGVGGPAGSTSFYTIYLFQRAFKDFDMGYASAMAWVLVLAVGLITLLLFRTSRSWVHYGGDR